MTNFTPAMSHKNTVFKPPAAFVEASRARLAKVRQLAEEREQRRQQDSDPEIQFEVEKNTPTNLSKYGSSPVKQSLSSIPTATSAPKPIKSFISKSNTQQNQPIHQVSHAPVNNKHSKFPPSQSAAPPPSSMHVSFGAKRSHHPQQQQQQQRSRVPPPPPPEYEEEEDYEEEEEEEEKRIEYFKSTPRQVPPPLSVTKSSQLPSSSPKTQPMATSRSLPIAIPQQQKEIPITTSSSPSKTLNTIKSIQQAREERRAKAAMLKEMKSSMDSAEQELFEYRHGIEQFNKEFAIQQKKLAKKMKETRVSKNLKIRVCVRKRPLNSSEKERKELDVITAATSHYPYAHAYVHEPKLRVDLSKHLNTHRFIFDDVFDETSNNEEVYLSTAKPLVDRFLKKGRVTFFAYGQTGSGKTHTIFGKNNDPGLYTYCCRDIFKRLRTPDYADLELRLTVCFFEIYGGKVYDLLSNKKKVQLLEDSNGNVQVFGLEYFQVNSLEDLMRIFSQGTQLRTTGSTEANPESSRSHAIFQLMLLEPDDTVYGKFSLVDLAGSERGADTGNISRQARIEGAEINKSLLALKECIRALHNRGEKGKEEHVPFRASKLTQILRDSFIGKGSRTVMVATISPGMRSCEHTLNTLRYSDRVKEFKSNKSGNGQSEAEVVSPIFEDDIVNDQESDHEDDVYEEHHNSADERDHPHIYPPRNKKPVVGGRQPAATNGYARGKGPTGSQQNQNNQRQQQHLHPNQARQQQQQQQQRQVQRYVESEDESEDDYPPQNRYQAHRQTMKNNMRPKTPVDEEEDLAFLRRRASNKSAELYSLNEVVNEVIQGEENLVEMHREILDQEQELVQLDQQLIDTISQPGNDLGIDEYTRQLETILMQKIQMFTDLHKKVVHMKELLSREEEASHVLDQDEDDEEN